jgi:16S rRNA processing protein RimM
LLLRNELTSEEKNVTVSSYRVHKGLDLVKFLEIDATTATTYFSWYVLAEKDDIKLPGDTYFHVDLIGCVLIDESNNELGKVQEVVDYGAHPILKAKTFNEGKAFQVPFIPSFIIAVDINHKTITIRPIEGLL